MKNSRLINILELFNFKEIETLILIKFMIYFKSVLNKSKLGGRVRKIIEELIELRMTKYLLLLIILSHYWKILLNKII